MTAPANPTPDPQTGPGATPPAPAPTTPPAPTPPADPPSAPAPSATDTARLAALEESLKNTGKERDDFKAILERLGAVLNPGSAADPKELTAKLEEKDAALAETKLELAVLRLAGGDVGSNLLDSRKFMKAVKGLDPNGDAFAEKVKAALAEMAPPADDDGKTDPPPKGKPGAPPRKSAGADTNGGRTGAKKQLTRADLAAMSSEEIVKAQDDGLLDNLMKGVG